MYPQKTLFGQYSDGNPESLFFVHANKTHAGQLTGTWKRGKRQLCHQSVTRHQDKQNEQKFFDKSCGYIATGTDSEGHRQIFRNPHFPTLSGESG